MIELVPAIDLIDGKCVRLSQGDFGAQKVYNENPLDVALMLEASGIHRLHVVDLDGAVSHRVVNYRTLEQLASHTSLVIDFGGGVKDDENLKIAFESGARMVTGGSIAVRRPEVFCSWLQRYGADRIILGADVKDGRIAIGGWKEDSKCELFAFLEGYVGKGVRKVICTDIGRDGMLQGPAVDLYQTMQARHAGLEVIASGGISSMEDIRTLDEAGVPGVIFGKALYEGRITLKELESWMSR